MNKIVCLDLDNCIANFNKAFCEKFGNSGQYWVSLEQRYPQKAEKIKKFVENSETYRYLEVIELGKKIAQFFDYSGYRVHINTFRPISAKQNTFYWLREHGIPFCKLVIGNGKIQHIEETEPAFIMDDLLSVVEHTADYLEIPSFLIDQPWNRKGGLPGNIHRIENYSEFLTIMEKLY